MKTPRVGMLLSALHVASTPALGRVHAQAAINFSVPRDSDSLWLQIHEPTGSVMPWLLLLHIFALICWCGSLLYLPALIHAMAEREELGLVHNTYVARRVFTMFSTPAALLAVISGTSIFLLERTAELWLVAKLTLVGGLAVCHVLVGQLTIFAKRGRTRHLTVFSVVVSAASLAFIAGILWLVLAEPF